MLGAQFIRMGCGDENVAGVFGMRNANGGQDVGVSGDNAMIVVWLRDGEADEQRDDRCVHLLLMIGVLHQPLKNPGTKIRPQHCRPGVSRIHGRLHKPIAGVDDSAEVFQVFGADVVFQSRPIVQILGQSKDRGRHVANAQILASAVVLANVPQERLIQTSKVQPNRGIRMFGFVRQNMIRGRHLEQPRAVNKNIDFRHKR